MKLQLHDLVELKTNKSIVFKLTAVSDNNVLMVDVQRPNDLWSAHPDDIEIIKPLQFISELSRNK